MAWELPPPDTLEDFARTMHEYYESLLKQGFDQHEALHLVLGQGCCMRES